MNKIFFIERETGEEVEEKVPARNILKFLYYSNLGKLPLNALIKRKIVSKVGGKYMNTKRSKNRVDNFIKKFDIDLSQFIIPQEGFQTFNAFFYRKIKPEKRPIQKGIVSPADGRILVFPNIQTSNDFFIKGSSFNLKTFIGNNELAQRYHNGSMAIIRLAPVDYHRFHFPADGITSKPTKIKGAYYSVSPVALQQNLEIFCQNVREYCLLKTTYYKEILICEVGATLTGSIVQTYESNSFVLKGQEKGYFAFGGSTLVLLFEKGLIQFSEDLIKNTQKGFETKVLMGETIVKQSFFPI